MSFPARSAVWEAVFRAAESEPQTGVCDEWGERVPHNVGAPAAELAEEIRMMKRLLILTVLAGALAVSTGAHAACGGARDIATVTSPANGIEVSIVADVAGGCDDGSLNTAGPLAAPTKLTIKKGDVTCTAVTESAWDPFGFGAGIHNTITEASACAADVSWGGFTSAYSPAIDRTDGAYLGKNAGVENGVVAIDGVAYPINGAGRMYTGLGGEL
jgi:hypothetical protein